MPGHIRHRNSGLLGECFNGARTLGEQIEQFQALRGGDRLPNPGELLVNAVLIEALWR